MNLHEIFNNPKPTYEELSYLLQKSCSIGSTLEELNIILDYSLKNLKTVTARFLMLNIKETQQVMKKYS